MQNFGEWIKELFTTYIEYLKFWVAVNHYQEAVVLRAGRYHRTLGPGYHPKWPVYEYSFDVNVKSDTMEIEAVSITTLDGKSITIGIMIEYQIVDTMLFLVETNEAYTNMKEIARGEISDYLEDINWADIKKKVTKNAVTRLISKKYVEMGVELKDLKFTDKCENKVFKHFGNLMG
jgi:regulator of protease activity HflC (stomatin/prohibitin superfamily)